MTSGIWGAARRVTQGARIAFGCVLAATLWLSVTAALGQDTAPTDQEDSSPVESSPSQNAAIPMEDIPAQSELTITQLQDLLRANDASAALADLRNEVVGVQRTLELGLLRIRNALDSGAGISSLDDLSSQMRGPKRAVEALNVQLDQTLDGLRVALEQLEQSGAVWRATRDQIQDVTDAESMQQRVRATLAEIDDARRQLEASRQEALTLRDQLIDPKATLDRRLKDIEAEIERRRASIFRRDQLPLWSARLARSIEADAQGDGPMALRERLSLLTEYLHEHLWLLGLQFTVFLGLAIGLRSLRTLAQKRADESYDLRIASRVLELPTSMALVIALILTTLLHPLAPRLLYELAFMLVALPAGVIVYRLIPPRAHPLLLALLATFVLDAFRAIVDELPNLERLVFLTQLVGSLGFLSWLHGSGRLRAGEPDSQHQPVLRLLQLTARAFFVLLTFSLLADVIGLGDLAELVGGGALRSAYAAIFGYALLKVCQSLVAYALVIWPLRRLKMVQRHRKLVRRRLESGLALLVAGLWLYVTVKHFGLELNLGAAASTALGAQFAIGEITISLADVAVFVITIWLTFVLARLLDFVLSEEIFPRVRMARGVPYAISSLARYSLITFGCLFAAVAAGIELSKLTIVAGGLGVGIGFGLQNVVSNFVSGLILLFERQVRVGDQVDLETLTGRVRQIGFRASMVRTSDGADVIVPNSKLISEEVVNWTGFDRERRIELPIVVEAGTDARRVIEVLLSVARAHPSIIVDPPPQALLLTLGASTDEFVLRAWLDGFTDHVETRSELAIALQTALAEAGINAPLRVPERSDGQEPPVGGDVTRPPKDPVETP